MEHQNTCWMQQGNNYRIVPSSIQINNTLSSGVYSICYSLDDGFSLDFMAKSFEFDFEVLGIEQRFIDHVLTSYNRTSGNFGVLMNGVKGCGKTVTAKILANSFGLPVILVDTPYNGIANFLSSLNFPCVLFFDEYEKNFKTESNYSPGNDTNILTIMDGVFNCSARKIFLMTTNELTVNKCLLSRPSRIRYVKEFTNISKDVINYLMDKYLQDQNARELIFNYVASLDVVSVDIIKAIIAEINIHGIDNFPYIKEIFNVQISPVHYDVYTCNSKQVEDSIQEAYKTLSRYEQLFNKYSHRDKDEDKEFNGYYANEGTKDEHYVRGLYDFCHNRYTQVPARFEHLNIGDHIDGYGDIIAIDKKLRIVSCLAGSDVTYVYIPEQVVYSRLNVAYGYSSS